MTRTQFYSFFFEKRTTSKIVATVWNVTSEQTRLYIRNMRQFKMCWSAGQKPNLWTAFSENPPFKLQVTNTLQWRHFYLFLITFRDVSTNYFIQRSASWEINSSSVSQQILLILWNLEVHCRFHNSSPFIPFPSHFNPVHLLSYSFTVILSFPLQLGLPSGAFPSGFPTKALYAHRLFLI